MQRLHELMAVCSGGIANTTRLKILRFLADKDEASAGELREQFGMKPPHMSKYLSDLKSAGLLTTRKEGLYVYYRHSSPLVAKVYDALREVVVHQLEQNQDVLKTAAGR